VGFVVGLGLDWVVHAGGADCLWDEFAGEEGEFVAVWWEWLLVVIGMRGINGKCRCRFWRRIVF